MKRKLLVVEVPHEWNLRGNWISCREVPTAEELGRVALDAWIEPAESTEQMHERVGQAVIERLTKGKP